ncbi:unnamed protein product [marine sediment metagenome]|uniref:Uncharacterized protein n=1 Tax=marine sediment metagenome TaxID=412755 RepID=X0ZIY7_9ZZZZ
MEEEKRVKFFKAYAQLPKALTSQIIVVVDEKPYTWDTVYFEVKNKTPLSEKLLNTFFAMKLI